MGHLEVGTYVYNIVVIVIIPLCVEAMIVLVSMHCNVDAAGLRRQLCSAYVKEVVKYAGNITYGFENLQQPNDTTPSACQSRNLETVLTLSARPNYVSRAISLCAWYTNDTYNQYRVRYSVYYCCSRD